MNTYKISAKEIQGMKPVAVGYKIFSNNFVAHGYDYKDENENVVGTIHKVEGNIEECRWGLHFSELPQDCFNFYGAVQWNKFAKVEAYDKVIKSDKKSVTNILKIVEVYSFDDFIALIQKALQGNGVNGSKGVNGSRGVNGSKGVNESNGVNESKGVNESNGVNESKGVNESNGVSWSYGVNESNGVSWSYGVNGSKGVNESKGVNKSNGVSWSYGVNGSKGVNESKGVNKSNGVSWSYGVNGSKGVNESRGVNGSNGVNESNGVNGSKGVNGSYGITKCEAVSKCIFCFNQVGTKLKLFNKKTTEERVVEILNTIKFKYGWYPKFNNAEALRGNLEWYETNIPEIVKVPNEIAWSFMPEAMKEYIHSLPEYNEKVFKKVTGKID